MSNLDKKFYEISGSIFGITAWIIGFLSLTTATFLRIKADPTFSLTSNYICDLGFEKYDSSAIFSVGFILKGIFLLPFYKSLGTLLQKKIYSNYFIKGAIIASVISNLSLMMVVPFLFDPSNQFFCKMHGLLGFTYFSFGTFAFTLYGIIELSNPKISNFYTAISFITAFLQGLFLFLPEIYIIEWLFIASDFSWLLMHTMFLYKNDPSIMENIVFFELEYLLKHE